MKVHMFVSQYSEQIYCLGTIIIYVIKSETVKEYFRDSQSF